MPPVDDVGRLIVVDFGRESASRPLGEQGERRPDEWQPIGAVARRVLKGSIVAAGLRGSISRKHARRLIARMDLQSV